MPMIVSNCNSCGGSVQEPVFIKDGYELVRCSACGLTYVRNPPDDSERQRLYSFEAGYHAELAAHDVSVARHRAEARANLKLLERHACGNRLLDVGCSTGLFLLEARARQWPVAGLEYSRESAEFARDVNHLPVQQGELCSDLYAKGSFDTITMWDVIEHLPDPARAIRIASEILAEGGLLVLKTPNIDGLFPVSSLAVAPTLRFWSHPEPPEHLFQFSEATLTRMVRDAGFDVLQVCHRRIPLEYSFGSARGWFRSVKWLLYCLAFAPLATLGPLVRRGDDITVVARRRA